MGFFYPQAFITVHKNIVLNPAGIYAYQKYKGVPAVQEVYLMNAIIFQASRNHFSIDDRNMLWNRFTKHLAPRHYYRNRLRVGQSFKTWNTFVRLYGFEEVYYFFNQHTISRTRTACGVNSDVIKQFNLDVTYVRQWDKYAGDLNLFFVAGILKF